MESYDDAIPLFGIYNQNDYKMGTVDTKVGTSITYRLPNSQDGRYNIVLHKLLGLRVDEKKNCKVRIIA